MPLIRRILKRMSRKKRPLSPPPEIDVIEEIVHEERKKVVKFKYSYVGPKVDASPPAYDARTLTSRLPAYEARLRQLAKQNVHLLMDIKNAHFKRGRVDCHWRVSPKPCRWFYENRVRFLKQVQRENRLIYERLLRQGPKVTSTECLRKDWAHNWREIISRAQAQFVLFPPEPRDTVEDPAFERPPGVRRPRVYLTVQLEGHAALGELCAELFADVCPLTCALFLELLAGDTHGYSYVGTHFFRKVPRLFWTGGDVTHDNGFGCYMQRGRRVPIGAENYHFSHSMPGLLSMSVTCDDEMCGIFNIIFKPLPQFDLKNVVFGRIIRPSPVFDSISVLGTALSSRPPVIIRATRHRVKGEWVVGSPNRRLVRNNLRKPRSIVRSFHCENGCISNVK